MRDEGDAQFNAARVRDEVASNGGKDTGIPGQHEDGYQKIYDDRKAGKVSEDQAKSQMGDLMGQEKTSTTGESYRDYYGKHYASDYDQTAANSGSGS